MQQATHIGMIGTGKVASHLAMALKECGCTIDWVWSRTQAHAEKLAAILECAPIKELGQAPSTDLVIISISDDAVSAVSDQLQGLDPATAVVHTSGSLGRDALAPHLKNTGIFYPLQTFSENRKPSLKGIPFCIEAGAPNLQNKLQNLATLLGGIAVSTTQEQRMQLHIAAIFACNFSNYLYSCSEAIMEKAALPFELLHPLIQETTLKAILYRPSEVQTGPAIRGDNAIIEKHLEWLKQQPELRDVYALLSSEIMKKNKTHE